MVSIYSDPLYMYGVSRVKCVCLVVIQCEKIYVFALSPILQLRFPFIEYYIASTDTQNGPDNNGSCNFFYAVYYSSYDDAFHDQQQQRGTTKNQDSHLYSPAAIYIVRPIAKRLNKVVQSFPILLHTQHTRDIVMHILTTQ